MTVFAELVVPRNTAAAEVVAPNIIVMIGADIDPVAGLP
jgi:hypothetical protein